MNKVEGGMECMELRKDKSMIEKEIIQAPRLVLTILCTNAKELECIHL